MALRKLRLLTLFSTGGNSKKRKLMANLDSINTKWGRNTLQCAAGGIKKGWRVIAS
jgi:hypothetical protein